MTSKPITTEDLKPGVQLVNPYPGGGEYWTVVEVRTDDVVIRWEDGHETSGTLTGSGITNAIMRTNMRTEHEAAMAQITDTSDDQGNPVCWCGASAEYVNPATDASPAMAVCPAHTADGYAPISSLTPDSLALFLAYADDAGNWSGNPWVDGNISLSAAGRGNLTDLKRKGLLETQTDDGDAYIIFTDAGKALAAAHGIDLSWC